MLKISVEKENGEPVIKLENEKVAPADLPARLASLVRQSGKVLLIARHDDDVPWGAVAVVHDAAKFAGIQQAVLWVVPKEFLPNEPKKK
jgi:hypothetical protein